MYEHPLDKAFRLSFDASEKRQEFYDALIDGEVYVFGQPKIHKEAEISKYRDLIIHIESKPYLIAAFKTDRGEDILPVFTSFQQFEAFFGDEERFIIVPVEALFQQLDNLLVDINPASRENRILNDLARSIMLTGRSLVAAENAPRILGFRGSLDGQIVRLKRIPQNFIDALTPTLTHYPQIKAAYMVYNVVGEYPEPLIHILIGIEVKGPFDPIAAECYLSCQNLPQPNGGIIFCQMGKHGDIIPRKIRETTPPFYKNRKAALFGN